MGSQQSRHTAIRNSNGDILFSIRDVDKEPRSVIMPDRDILLPFHIWKFENHMRFYLGSESSPLLMTAVILDDDSYKFCSFSNKTIGRLQKVAYASFTAYRLFLKNGHYAGEIQFFGHQEKMLLPLGWSSLCVIHIRTKYSSTNLGFKKLKMETENDLEVFSFQQKNANKFLLDCGSPFSWLQAFAFAFATIVH